MVTDNKPAVGYLGSITDGPHLNRLAEWMSVFGIKDAELARLAGTSKQQIFKLRRSERKLTIEWARRLATALGIKWEELIEEPTAADLRITAIRETEAKLLELRQQFAIQAFEDLNKGEQEDLLKWGRAVAESHFVAGNQQDDLEAKIDLYAQGFAIGAAIEKANWERKFRKTREVLDNIATMATAYRW